MSRIGNQAIEVPSGVDVTIDGAKVTVKGKLGTLTHEVPDGITVDRDGERIVVRRERNERRLRALHGLTRALVRNMVVGVVEGYRRELEIHGVSYQASLQGKNLALKVGFANEVMIPVPEGLTVEVPNPTLIVVTGPDKQKVGQFAAELRQSRIPEPYKGKGVRYRGEYIQRKQGKSFVGTE